MIPGEKTLNDVREKTHDESVKKVMMSPVMVVIIACLSLYNYSGD